MLNFLLSFCPSIGTIFMRKDFARRTVRFLTSLDFLAFAFYDDSENSAIHLYSTCYAFLISLLLVTPVCKYFIVEQILKKIKHAGFKISAQKEISLTKELASQFYGEHEGKDFFNGLTDYMSRYLFI